MIKVLLLLVSLSLFELSPLSNLHPQIFLVLLVLLHPCLLDLRDLGQLLGIVFLNHLAPFGVVYVQGSGSVLKDDLHML